MKVEDLRYAQFGFANMSLRSVLYVVGFQSSYLTNCWSQIVVLKHQSLYYLLVTVAIF